MQQCIDNGLIVLYDVFWIGTLRQIDLPSALKYIGLRHLHERVWIHRVVSSGILNDLYASDPFGFEDSMDVWHTMEGPIVDGVVVVGPGHEENGVETSMLMTNCMIVDELLVYAQSKKKQRVRIKGADIVDYLIPIYVGEKRVAYLTWPLGDEALRFQLCRVDMK